MTDKERRRHERYDTRDVSGSLLFQTQVDILNISLTGLAVESPHRLEIDRTYDLRIAHDQERVSLSGRVVWCRLAATRRQDKGEIAPVYRAGLRFENTLSDKSQELVRFIEHNAILTLEQRIFGRFKFRAEGSVALDARYDFVVSNLSLAGMRIETDLIPEPDSRFDMRIRLGEMEVAIRGRIAHVQRRGPAAAGKKRMAAAAGVEFVETPEAAREQLVRFIDEELAPGG